MTHDEMIAVIAAHRDGKAIEWRSLIFARNTWLGFAKDAITWDFNSNEYRIKPEPREWWVNFYPGSSMGRAFQTKSEADRFADLDRIACVHVREVLP